MACLHCLHLHCELVTYRCPTASPSGCRTTLYYFLSFLVLCGFVFDPERLASVLEYGLCFFSIFFSSFSLVLFPFHVIPDYERVTTPSTF